MPLRKRIHQAGAEELLDGLLEDGQQPGVVRGDPALQGVGPGVESQDAQVGPGDVGGAADKIPAHVEGHNKDSIRILDPELTGEVLRTMRQLAQEHMTMLVVTHEMAFAREVAHRVCFMDKGQIVEERAARAFFEDPHHERARAFLEHVL